jgi:GNAT superfamily N-acetyltransferase
MIRQCNSKDKEKLYFIINEAAKAYRGKIPPERYHEPNMPMDELEREMKRIIFTGWEENGELVGIMGIERVGDVTLIRHAYVLPCWQRRGIAGRLLIHLRELVATPRLLVGTWATADWAISFYEKNGFKMMPDKDKLLETYWDIPRQQILESVVLGVGIREHE